MVKLFENIKGVISGVKTLFAEESNQETNPGLPGNSGPTSQFYQYGGGSMRPIYVETFDGEKEVDNMGPIKDYILDHAGLAARSRQSYIESEISRTLIDRFVMWVIGDGLKVQIEPMIQLLENEGIEVDMEDFEKQIEPYFTRFANSYKSDWGKERNIHQMCNLAAKTALLSGDCLIVGRIKNGWLSFQIIDGQWVRNPTDMPIGGKLQNNNKIDNGVEVNAKGQHVAYYVVQPDGYTTKRIEAYGRSTGMRFAWLIPGVKYRVSDNRGIPVLSATLETLKKLERYKEATVSTAEEAAKLTFQITHEAGSGQDNPFKQGFTKAFDQDLGDGDNLPTSYEGKNLENQVYSSTDRKAVNLPPGAELKPMTHSNGEINFKDFYHPNIQIISAAVGMPYEVMLSMYNSNFSASRAALKDWEHTLNVWRTHFGDHFYQPIYDLFFTQKVIQNKVRAPGYLEAFMDNDEEILEAYRATRWVGKNVPHIDPVKEIEALRRQLGSKAKHLPLTTLRKATEKINNGDSTINLQKFAEELQKAEELDIQPDTEEPQNPAQPNSEDDQEQENE